MKKLVALFIVLFITTTGIVGCSELTMETSELQAYKGARASMESDTQPYVKLKNKNGFIVLDIKEKSENHNTIVAQITDGSDYGFELDSDEFFAVNVFDYADFVIITDSDFEGLEEGKTYLITFNGDDVVSVRENDLTISVADMILVSTKTKQGDGF